MNNASLLPPNATDLERALEAADATVMRMPMRHGQIKNPWTCPASYLPWLAWELSLDTWDSAWPTHIKRQRIASAISIQRHKGTAGSVREVIQSFGGSVVLREWWQQEPPGYPHTFEVVLNVSGNADGESAKDFVQDIIAEVNRTKPVRSHFIFTQGIELSQSLGAVGAVRTAVYRRIRTSEQD